MFEIQSQPSYFVVFFTTKYKSMDEVIAKSPETLATHVSRSNELRKKGKLLMAGAFRNESDEPVKTMAVCYSKEDAEEYAKGDPFLLIGKIAEWHIVEWSNIFREQTP